VEIWPWRGSTNTLTPQETIVERTGSIVGTFKEHSGSIQGTFTAARGTFGHGSSIRDSIWGPVLFGQLGHRQGEVNMMGCVMNFRVVIHMGCMVSRWRSAEQRLTWHWLANCKGQAGIEQQPGWYNVACRITVARRQTKVANRHGPLATTYW